MIMKKFIFILLAGFSVIISAQAQASSIILEPKVVVVRVGETFTLQVVIDPLGSSQYTTRFSITFPPDRLEVTSFVFGNNWLAVPQPLYDLLDNQRGRLIKTGGWPKGFSSPVSFGVITFRAKKAGDSVINVSSQSFILDATNKSTLTSRPQVRVVAVGGPLPPVSTIEPLLDLPAGEPNLFDISLTPEQVISRRSMMFFTLLFLIAIFLGITGRFIFVWFKRRLIEQKIKNDKDF